MVQRVKRLPARWETPVLSLGRQDPLEKEMATHSSILAWRIPWTEKPGIVHGVAKSRTRLSGFTFLFFFFFSIRISLGLGLFSFCHTFLSPFITRASHMSLNILQIIGFCIT